MRYLPLLFLLVTGPAVAGWLNVTETRDLTLVDNASGRFTFSGIEGVIRDES